MRRRRRTGERPSARAGWAPRWTVWLTLAAASAATMTALSVPPPWTLSAGLASATAAHLLRRARADGRSMTDLRDAATALRAVARELHAGVSPSDAVRRIREDAPVRVAAMLESLAGTALRERLTPPRPPVDAAAACAALARSGRVPAARSVGRRCVDRGRGARGRVRPEGGDLTTRLSAAWTVAHRTGIPLANVVEAIADDLADRSAARQARAGQVAGPAVSGYVLAALPVAGLLLGAGMGSDPFAVLGTGAVGGMLLMLGVALMSGGLVWTDRIVRGGARQ